MKSLPLRSALSIPRSRRIRPPMTEQPAAGAPQASPADPNAESPHCLKPQALCVCEGIARIDNKVSLLILQHPQELAEPHQDPRPPDRSAALGDPLSRFG
jgi:hypothetical protein